LAETHPTKTGVGYYTVKTSSSELKAISRDSILCRARCMLSPVRLSVTITRCVDHQSKTIEVDDYAIFALQYSSISLVLQDKFHPQILTDLPV